MSDEKFKDLDELFDAVFKDDISPEELRRRVNRNNQRNPRNRGQNPYTRNRRIQIIKPVLKKDARDRVFKSRYEYFINYITNIEFHPATSADYYGGFEDAIEQYHNRAESYKNNLIIVENVVKDEIRGYNNSVNSSIYSRGYYDGLCYIEGSLKRSKKMIEEEIVRVLKNTII